MNNNIGAKYHLHPRVAIIPAVSPKLVSLSNVGRCGRCRIQGGPISIGANCIYEIKLITKISAFARASQERRLSLATSPCPRRLVDFINPSSRNKIGPHGPSRRNFLLLAARAQHVFCARFILYMRTISHYPEARR